MIDRSLQDMSSYQSLPGSTDDSSQAPTSLPSPGHAPTTAWSVPDSLKSANAKRAVYVTVKISITVCLSVAAVSALAASGRLPHTTPAPGPAGPAGPAGPPGPPGSAPPGATPSLLVAAGFSMAY